MFDTDEKEIRTVVKKSSLPYCYRGNGKKLDSKCITECDLKICNFREKHELID